MAYPPRMNARNDRRLSALYGHLCPPVDGLALLCKEGPPISGSPARQS